MKLPKLPENIKLYDIKKHMEYYDEYYKLLQLNFPIEEELDDYDIMKKVLVTDYRLFRMDTDENDEDEESDDSNEVDDDEDGSDSEEDSPNAIKSQYVYNSNAKRQIKNEIETDEGPSPVTISFFLYDEQKKKLIGIFYVEYYPIAQVGQLNYFCLAQGYKGKKLGKYMLVKAYQATKQLHSKFHKMVCERKGRKMVGKLPYAIENDNVLYFDYAQKKYNLPKKVVDHIQCYDEEIVEDGQEEPFFFLAETNKIGVDDGVLKSEVRHTILEKLGFSHIPIKYVQPPLSEDMKPCYDLLLLALNANDTPIPSARLLLYMIEFGYSIEDSWAFPESKWFSFICGSLLQHEEIELSEEQAPWKE